MFFYRVPTLDGSYEGECNVLIILDACRYDYFSELCNIDGYLQKLHLSVTNTFDWLFKSWWKFYDITYISGNPLVNSYTLDGRYNANEFFKEVVNAWETEWNEEYGSIFPENVTNIAKNYVDRDIIVHYMQPHAPYIGDTKLSIFAMQYFYLTALDKDPETDERFQLDKENTRQFYHKPDLELMINAYIDNLKLVLKSVEEFIDFIPDDKKVVITTDHSELLGYGKRLLIGHNHPENKEIPVPYLIVKR